MNYGAPPPGGYGGPPRGSYGPPGYGAPPPGGYGVPSAVPHPYGQPPSFAPAQPTGNPFPPRLADSPQNLRIHETFGWFPASLATASILAIVGTFVMAITQGGFDSMDQMKFCAIAAGVAALCATWEIWRRTHPTSLVVADNRLGIYRKGMLEGVVGFGQITWFRLNIANSIREYMLFGIFGFGGLFGVLGGLSAESAPAVLWSAAAAFGGLGGLASSIWSRGMCLHYYIPKGNGTETVVLRKGDLTRVGWPSNRWG